MSEAKNSSRRLIQRKLVAIVVAISMLMFAGTTVLYFGQEGTDSFPSISNSKASGLAAFSELLIQDGYKVVLDRDERPQLNNADLVIAILPEKVEFDTSSLFGAEDGEKPTPQIEISLGQFIARGGTVLSLPMANDFANATNAAAEKTISLGDKKYQVSVSQTFAVLGLESLDNSENNNESALSIDSLPSHGLLMQSGIGATNRFIGKLENAQFYLDAVRKLAPPGSTIVFAEASFGNTQNRNLSNDLGNWIAVAGWQLFIVVGVIMFSVGRRFGFPVEDRFEERGTHELIHSMSNILRRGRHYDQASMILLDETYNRMRKALRAPLGADPATLTKMAPAELGSAIIAIRQQYGQKLQSQEWRKLTSKLEYELHSFETSVKSQKSLDVKIK